MYETTSNLSSDDFNSSFPEAETIIDPESQLSNIPKILCRDDISLNVFHISLYEIPIVIILGAP